MPRQTDKLRTRDPRTTVLGPVIRELSTNTKQSPFAVVFEFQRVGCDHILDSNALVDRCGICGGNGDSCFKVEGFYNKSHTITGNVSPCFERDQQFERILIES